MMRNVISSHSRMTVLLIIMSLVAGCIVVPGRHRYYVGGVVAVAPPVARVEAYGAPPSPGHIWIDGYWNWVGGRHVWVDGHWEAPRAGFHYVPHNWLHERDGWRLSEGHWERD